MTKVTEMRKKLQLLIDERDSTAQKLGELNEQIRRMRVYIDSHQ